MRHKYFLILFPVLLLFISSQAATLQQAYQQAQPGMGYDRLIILKADSLYLGGLTVFNESIGIKGNGALIDLQGSRIEVRGTSMFDMDACVVVNGTDGLFIEGETTAMITHCTFFANQIGIRYESPVGYIEIVNSILAFNSQYGFACDENTYSILHYIDAYQNGLMDYAKWCVS